MTTRLIIDVREKYEYEEGHVAGALNIPLLEVSTSGLGDADTDTQVIVYCRSGGRAAAAVQVLRGRGFSDVVNGIDASNVEENYL